MFVTLVHAATEVAAEAPQGALGTLGVNGKLFLAQLINFGIVLFILWRPVWKPVVKVLDDRVRRIEQSVADAKCIEDELKSLDARRNKLMRDADVQAQRLIAEGTVSAEANRADALMRARAESEKILHDGKIALETEKTRLIREAKTELATLVITATEKVLEETMDDKRHRALVEKVIERV